MKAASNADLPHFLILDEMNLSHVEVFCRLFKCYGNERSSLLHSDVELKMEFLLELKFPSICLSLVRLTLMGNHQYVCKVLDRPIPSSSSYKGRNRNFLDNMRDINMDALVGRGLAWLKTFQEMAVGNRLAK